MAVPLAELIDAYLDGARLLRQAVTGLSPEQGRFRSVPGRWSTLEVACHLADIDALDAERMKRLIAEERPVLMDADEKLYEAALAYPERDLETEVALIEQTRRQMARILGALPESAWQRVGIHNEAGPLTLADLLTRATNHITHHVKFIHDKRRALGLAVCTKRFPHRLPDAGSSSSRRQTAFAFGFLAPAGMASESGPVCR